MTEQNLEERVEKKNINLGRIAKNAVGYGILGAFFDDAVIMMPVNAVIGAGITFYDEIKNKNMNLAYPFVGIFAGGAIGGIFKADENGILPDALAIVGATIGFYKSYINAEKH